MKNIWQKFKYWLIKKLGGQVSLPIAPQTEYHVERPIALFAEIEADNRTYERDEIGTEREIKRYLAEKIVTAILEKDLLDIVVHEDPIRWQRTYRASLRVITRKR